MTDGRGLASDRPTLLVTVPNYLPGYKAGGAIRTVSAMCRQLQDDFRFKILTSDRDAGDDSPYPDIRRDAWVSRPEAEVQVQYLSPRNQGIAGLRRAITSASPDLLYLNGIYHPVFVLRPLMLRRLGLIPDTPVVIAARGHLSPGAMAVKAWRKRLYIHFLRICRLLDGAVFQASDAMERREIRDVLPGADARVAPNVTPQTRPGNGSDAEPEPLRKAPGSLRAVFLSRISPKKNLLGALKACRQISKSLTLCVVGPVGDERYWDECQRYIERLPNQVEVVYHGAVAHDDVPKTLKDHHLFFLPSHSENYGHVIREALEAGRPVLISDQTPWRGLEDSGAGWVCPVSDTACFSRRLEYCVEMTHEEFADRCRAARCYVADARERRDAVARNRSLLMDVLKGG